MGARIALFGNPNTGKSTLFNRLCARKSKTANYPGSTVECETGRCNSDYGDSIELIDSPGVYSLSVESIESKLCDELLDDRTLDGQLDAVIIVLDANNLLRNLQFAASVLRRGIPAVVAINMMDVAERRGLTINEDSATAALGVPAVPISALSGEGVDRLMNRVRLMSATRKSARPTQPYPTSDPGSTASAIWANAAYNEMASYAGTSVEAQHRLNDRLDAAFAHPVLGIAAFCAVMTLLFASIFWIAQFPMDAIDFAFSSLATFVASVLPTGVLSEFLVNAVIGGLATTIVFLPQIMLLFFLLALLEDSGYLARASFAVDRVMRRFGLPGQAFMPLLSSHACALPGIMSTRLIPSRRDRLATILVAPFMSCSARVPVYALLIGVLFAGRPLAAGIGFVSCYALGAGAGLLTSLLIRSTILRGKSQPMMLEFPDYRLPSVSFALRSAVERGWVFIKNAGTMILMIAIVMWWLGAYPKVAPSDEYVALEARVSEVSASDPTAGAALQSRADRLLARDQQSGSFAGKMGQFLQPVFAPLGLDRQLTVAVLASFLAREVFTTTVFVLAGEGQGDDADAGTLARVRAATRDDATPLFTTATSASLLVYFVLAMQCLPTLVVVRRETGSWKWPILQFCYMSAVAYAAALVTYRVVS